MGFNTVRAVCRDRRGIAAVEYAVIAVGIIGALAVGTMSFGGDVNQTFSRIANGITPAVAPTPTSTGGGGDDGEH